MPLFTTMMTSLTLSLSRYHYLFSLLSVISFSLRLFQEFGSGSTNHALIDIFLYSHHLFACCCIDIIRRNSVLVTHKSSRVNTIIIRQIKYLNTSGIRLLVAILVY